MKDRILLWTVAAIALVTPYYASAKQHPHKSYRTHSKTRHYTPVAAPIPSQQQEQMLSDLGFIQNLFKIAYAPTEWKNEHFGWHLEQEIMDVKKNIVQKSDLTIKEFQTIISDEFVKRTIQATMLLSSEKSPESKYPIYPQFITPHYNRLSCSHEKEGQPSVRMGAKKNMLPALGEILQEAPEDISFHAYLFKLPGGKTGGYVRIPSYGLDGNTATPEFLEIIKQCEEKSDVLVIDQLSNPGGSLLFLYSLLSLLTDQPLSLPMHRSKITQKDVFYADQDIYDLRDIQDDEMAKNRIGTTQDGYPVDFNYALGLLKFQQDLIDEWNEGKTFTNFQYLNGIETITPNPDVHYTKPILVLVNSLDFSGGDFFPAILQDNHRAKVMGMRTAGAGGKVEKFFFPNLNSIRRMNLTTSFALRSNGMPIENLGVTPDIPYEITALDLQNNYADFVAKILEVLESLIPI